MRSSFVTLAAFAGALVTLTSSEAAGGCCAHLETPGSRVFEEATPKTRESPPPDPSPRPTPLDYEAERLAVGNTYVDVFRTLQDDNSCSRFFGGPRVAVSVFNEFARRLRRKSLNVNNVGLIMSGSYTWYQDMESGASYRLFDEATINNNGPFVAVPSPSGTRFQIGRFPAATRPARALMLLHELGHLIRGPEGWLLQPDGGDAALSDRNTRTVESRCIEQLLALRE